MEHTVIRQFSRASLSYDRYASVQPEVACELLTHMSADLNDSDVLEVGAGTGFLTERLLERFPRIRLTALDVSHSMLERLSDRLGARYHFHRMESEFTSLQLTAKVDAICTSSALHWCGDLGRAFFQSFELLRDGGKFYAAIMLQGTLHELHSLRRELFPMNTPRRVLPSLSDVLDNFWGSGFRTLFAFERRFEACYNSVEEFFAHLKGAGVTGGEFSQGSRPLTRSELSSLMAEYRVRFCKAHKIYSSYEVLFLGGEK